MDCLKPEVGIENAEKGEAAGAAEGVWPKSPNAGRAEANVEVGVAGRVCLKPNAGVAGLAGVGVEVGEATGVMEEDILNPVCGWTGFAYSLVQVVGLAWSWCRHRPVILTSSQGFR